MNNIKFLLKNRTFFFNNKKLDDENLSIYYYNQICNNKIFDVKNINKI